MSNKNPKGPGQFGGSGTAKPPKIQPPNPKN